MIASADMRRLSEVKFSSGTFCRRPRADGDATAALTSASGVVPLPSAKGCGGVDLLLPCTHTIQSYAIRKGCWRVAAAKGLDAKKAKNGEMFRVPQPNSQEPHMSTR